MIDLRGVTMIDSSGLALLVHADRQCQRRGRAMACVIRPGRVARLFYAAGLGHKLLLRATPQGASTRVLPA